MKKIKYIAELIMLTALAICFSDYQEWLFITPLLVIFFIAELIIWVALIIRYNNRLK